MYSYMMLYIMRMSVHVYIFVFARECKFAYMYMHTKLKNTLNMLIGQSADMQFLSNPGQIATVFISA